MKSHSADVRDLLRKRFSVGRVGPRVARAGARAVRTGHGRAHSGETGHPDVDARSARDVVYAGDLTPVGGVPLLVFYVDRCCLTRTATARTDENGYTLAISRTAAIVARKRRQLGRRFRRRRTRTCRSTCSDKHFFPDRRDSDRTRILGGGLEHKPTKPFRCRSADEGTSGQRFRRARNRSNDHV